MDIDWEVTFAAIWRQRKEHLRPVRNIDPVRLRDLVGIEPQKEQLILNTERFLARKPANNALLWGARGTGKSSLVKAVLNEYTGRGLRLIEVDKDDLIFLPEIVDRIRELPQFFLIFCDDLSFDVNESSYKHLKSVLEGSIEQRPDNVLLYATSNRRHLLPESMQDNLDTRVSDDEIHYSDAVEEKISLSDRFGLWISFYPLTWTNTWRSSTVISRITPATGRICMKPPGCFPWPAPPAAAGPQGSFSTSSGDSSPPKETEHKAAKSVRVIRTDSGLSLSGAHPDGRSQKGCRRIRLGTLLIAIAKLKIYNGRSRTGLRLHKP